MDRQSAVPGAALAKGLFLVIAVLTIPASIAVYLSADDLARQPIEQRSGRSVQQRVDGSGNSTASAVRLDAVLGICVSVVLLGLAFAIDTHPLVALLSGTYICLNRFAALILTSLLLPSQNAISYAVLGLVTVVALLLLYALRTALAAPRKPPGEVDDSRPRVSGRAIAALHVAFVLLIATPVTALLVVQKSSPGVKDPEDFLVLSAINAALLAVIVLGTVIFARLPKRLPVTLMKANAWTIGPLAMLLLATVALAYQYGLSRLLPDVTLQADMGEHAHLLLGWIVVACLVPAIYEEWLFRRLAIAAFESRMGVRWAILVSSVMFASAHVLTPLSFPILLLLGLILGWTHVQTGKLALPILLHGGFNLILLTVSVT